MPLLDHFRLPLLGKPGPVVIPDALPSTRLDRVIARGNVPVRTEIERRIQAMEEECSEPLYGASAYGSPGADEWEA
jgi:hypothetical protein